MDGSAYLQETLNLSMKPDHAEGGEVGGWRQALPSAISRWGRGQKLSFRARVGEGQCSSACLQDVLNLSVKLTLQADARRVLEEKIRMESCHALGETPGHSF